MDVTLKTPAKQAKSAEADYQNKDTIVIRFGVIASISTDYTQYIFALVVLNKTILLKVNSS
jgi:hypothetical protein